MYVRIVGARNGKRFESTYPCGYIETTQTADGIQVELCPPPAPELRFLTIPADGTDIFVMNDKNGATIQRYRWPPVTVPSEPVELQHAEATAKMLAGVDKVLEQQQQHEQHQHEQEAAATAAAATPSKVTSAPVPVAVDPAPTLATNLPPPTAIDKDQLTRYSTELRKP